MKYAPEDVHIFLILRDKIYQNFQAILRILSKPKEDLKGRSLTKRQIDFYKIKHLKSLQKDQALKESILT